jgi:dolichyl-phosphate-mannose-protein mannosyltransferase
LQFPLKARAAAFVLFFAFAALFQFLSGAYRSEFGGHPDEAAHYVTGLMVRDFIATPRAWAHPKAFAADYYLHYPKIGLGIWPPVFYVVQSAWTLVFTPARASVLLLMAALAAALALVFFETLRPRFGVTALVGALALLALPLVQSYYAMVMAETLSALLMFGAAVLFGKFLDDENPRDAIGFALCASLAILTKGTGLALALVPPLAILFTRKFSLLKNRWLWIAAAIVLVLAGPWTFATRDLGKGGWLEPNPSWHFTKQALGYYAGKLFVAVGLLIALIALSGAVVAFRSREQRGFSASLTALVIGVWFFQSLAPVGLEARHLIPAVPAVMAFFVIGLSAATKWLMKGRRFTISNAVAVESLWALAYAIFGIAMAIVSSERLPTKHFSGFGPVAYKLLNNPRNRDAVLLVSSDATGEGMFISEVAMRDAHRPGHIVQRASKAFTPDTGFAKNWSGAQYQPRFSTEAALRDFLINGEPGKPRIDFLAVDNSVPERNRVLHHDLLRRAIESDPLHFVLVCSSPLIRAGVEQKTPVRAYRIVRR